MCPFWQRKVIMNESKYRTGLIKRIKTRLPGAEVILNDPHYIQAIPDVLVLYNNHWAMLETKRDKDAPHRPNQDYYVSKYGQMAYAAFVFPENEEKILDEMERSLKT